MCHGIARGVHDQSLQAFDIGLYVESRWVEGRVLCDGEGKQAFVVSLHNISYQTKLK